MEYSYTNNNNKVLFDKDTLEFEWRLYCIAGNEKYVRLNAFVSLNEPLFLIEFLLVVRLRGAIIKMMMKKERET